MTIDDSNDRELTEEQQAVLELWTNGLGDSSKRLTGEDPMPPKDRKATRESWQARDMPSLHEDFHLGLEITAEERDILELGHIPRVMEDHWFMYYEDDVIHYHRSWTGICVFEAKVEPLGDHFVVSDARVNCDPEQYAGGGIEKDRSLLAILIMTEVGRIY